MNKNNLIPGQGKRWSQFKPSKSILQCFENPSKERDITITFSSEELTANCPLTSHPDFYKIKIQYVPLEHCIESKSAKLYLGSYRNEGMFIEALTTKIFKDWCEVVKPKYAKITNTMAARGGIPITVESEYFTKDGK